MAKSTKPLTYQIPSAELLRESFERYFGLTPGGVNWLQVLDQCPFEKLGSLKQSLEKLDRKHARVFLCGNGGSFDNARLGGAALSGLEGTQKFKTVVEGVRDVEFGGYGELFERVLRKHEVCSGDMVIGISGSGNSGNVNKALQYAISKGAAVFALGGRDGGEMRRVAGDERTAISATQSMEALEDAHAYWFEIVARSLRTGASLENVHKEALGQVRACLSSQNMQRMGELGQAILRTIYSESYFHVVGRSLGAQHLRADMGRGWTNGIPLRGISALELYSDNAEMACGNDDGFGKILVDWLAKLPQGQGHFALLVMRSTAEAAAAKEAEEYLKARGTPYMKFGHEVGEGGVDFTPLTKGFASDFAPTVLAHAGGDVIRATLQAEFHVQPLGGNWQEMVTLGGDKKPTVQENTRFEAKLRELGLLPEGRVITWAYNQPYLADDPVGKGLRREHY